MTELLIYKDDWDKAVARITGGDPEFSWDRTPADDICEHCAISIAARRQFGAYSYMLDTLDVDGVGSFTGPRLLYEMCRFDWHLMYGRLAPCVWPVHIELHLTDSERRES